MYGWTLRRMLRLRRVSRLGAGRGPVRHGERSWHAARGMNPSADLWERSALFFGARGVDATVSLWIYQDRSCRQKRDATRVLCG